MPASQAVPSAPRIPKDATMVKVETVLEEGLHDVYAKLDPARKQKFKTEGETVAAKLSEMVRKATFKAREALMLITKWLMIIPGLNRFYLEQEAKLKADRIAALIEQERNKGV